MKRLEARPYREQKQPELLKRVDRCKHSLGRAPSLRVILVGSDPASALYVSNKERLAASLGIHATTIRLPSEATPESVRHLVEELNTANDVDGILIQRPLPSSFSETQTLLWIQPEKDVDAFHPESVGRFTLGLPGFAPCTPDGCMKLLDFYGYDVGGKTACVVGRSSIVGKPLVQALLRRNATVIHCHSKSQNLSSFTQQADFLFVATGKPGLIGKDHVKPGAVVVDIGISKNTAGETVGDVLFDEVATVASAITPVPGGIGPMTVLSLMENTVAAAEARITLLKNPPA
jgi:methylenetetrahydrofolate dehydrogenase (NADP+)/methenyltetrahydrofolate cyclohydrolase